MTTPADAAERRKVQAVARRYRRGGYRVTVPRREGSVPPFLEGFTPDLIAESDRDRVVIEVKRSDAVPGSNGLLRVAEAVARQPGWRFELVTVAPDGGGAVPAEERIAEVESRARRAVSIGLGDAAYAYAWSALEALLNDLALRQGLRLSKVPFVQPVRELVSRGVVGRDVRDAVERAREVRNGLLHPGTGAPSSAADVERLLLLGRSLQGQLAAPQAGEETLRTPTV